MRTCCNHYCNKCSKWHPILWTQAQRCRLHSSVASLTAVCCAPDQTALRRCCSWSFKGFKNQSGLCLSFCCKFFHGSSTSSNSYRFLINKLWFSLHRPISVNSVIWCGGYNGNKVSWYIALSKFINYKPENWRLFVDSLYQKLLISSICWSYLKMYRELVF